MELFKKQRKRFQKWLNSFVINHHDDWWMPAFTVVLGLGYVLYGCLFIAMFGAIIAGLVACGDAGIWITVGVAAIMCLYFIGMTARVPGDSAWEQRHKEKNQ